MGHEPFSLFHHRTAGDFKAVILVVDLFLWGFCDGLCFGIHCFMSFLVLQSY